MASRCRPSTQPCRPPETIAASAVIRLPLSSSTCTRRFGSGVTAMDVTFSLQRSTMSCVRRSWIISSTVSWSMNEIGRAARSTSVTLVPSTAKNDAYSTPITPPPTTTRLWGISLSRPTVSLVRTIGESSDAWSGQPGGSTGRVPHASSVNAVVRVRSPSALSIEMVCSSTNDAKPQKILIPLRRSVARISCCSSWITDETRASSISIVRLTWSMPAASSERCTVPRFRLITASRKVLDGSVPRCTVTPPTPRFRSMSATRLPSFAAWIAADWPAGPLPITTRSNS